MLLPLALALVLALVLVLVLVQAAAGRGLGWRSLPPCRPCRRRRWATRPWRRRWWWSWIAYTCKRGPLSLPACRHGARGEAWEEEEGGALPAGPMWRRTRFSAPTACTQGARTCSPMPPSCWRAERS